MTWCWRLAARRRHSGEKAEPDEREGCGWRKGELAFQRPVCKLAAPITRLDSRVASDRNRPLGEPVNF